MYGRTAPGQHTLQMEAADGTGTGFSCQFMATAQPLLTHRHLGKRERVASHRNLGLKMKRRTYQPLSISVLLIEYEQQAGEGQHSWRFTRGSTQDVKLCSQVGVLRR